GSLEDLQQNAAARIVSGRFHQGMSELSGLRATRSNDLTMPPASALKPLAKLRSMTLGRFSTSPGGTTAAAFSTLRLALSRKRMAKPTNSSAWPESEGTAAPARYGRPPSSTNSQMS